MKRSIPFALTFLVLLVACQDSPDGQTEGAAPDTSAEAESADTSLIATGTPLLDPNEASREELLAVPGIGSEAADALLSGRPYSDMTAVDAVLARHMGEEEREEVYTRVWKPLDLNNASGEEILLIPGVGEQMLHEFEEYRPYRGMAEFRREIGKYVDADRIAEWERYVELR